MQRFFPAMVALAAAGTLSACNDDATGPADAARIRVVHAVADAPAVDVRIQEANPVLTAVPFRQFSNYLEVDPGQTRIRVLAAGTQTAVIDATQTLAANTDYTVIATGSLATIQPLVLVDDNAAPAAGQIKVRVVHAAATVANVDVYFSAPGAALPAQPTLTNVPFRGVSAYLAVPAGQYQVRVTPTGTTTVAIDVTTPNLAAGTVATAVAVDATGSSPLTALLLTDRAP